MMTITVEHETDTAHRLSCHKGKCANLHGHRYKFVVSIEARGSIESQEFVDFYDLKKQIREFLDDAFDHTTVLADRYENHKLYEALKAVGSKVKMMAQEPTVEAMVSWLKGMLDELPGLEGRLVQLTVYETPTNYCTWTKEGCRCLETIKK